MIIATSPFSSLQAIFRTTAAFTAKKHVKALHSPVQALFNPKNKKAMTQLFPFL